MSPPVQPDPPAADSEPDSDESSNDEDESKFDYTDLLRRKPVTFHRLHPLPQNPALHAAWCQERAYEVFPKTDDKGQVMNIDELCHSLIFGYVHIPREDVIKHPNFVFGRYNNRPLDPDHIAALTHSLQTEGAKHDDNSPIFILTDVSNLERTILERPVRRIIPPNAKFVPTSRFLSGANAPALVEVLNGKHRTHIMTVVHRDAVSFLEEAKKTEQAHETALGLLKNLGFDLNEGLSRMDLNSEPTEPPEIENLTRSGSLPDHFKYYFEQGSVEAVKRIAAAQSELSKECALNQRLVDGTRRWVFGIVNIAALNKLAPDVRRQVLDHFARNLRRRVKPDTSDDLRIRNLMDLGFQIIDAVRGLEFQHAKDVSEYEAGVQAESVLGSAEINVTSVLADAIRAGTGYRQQARSRTVSTLYCTDSVHAGKAVMALFATHYEPCLRDAFWLNLGTVFTGFLMEWLTEMLLALMNICSTYESFPTYTEIKAALDAKREAQPLEKVHSDVLKQAENSFRLFPADIDAIVPSVMNELDSLFEKSFTSARPHDRPFDMDWDANFWQYAVGVSKIFEQRANNTTRSIGGKMSQHAPARALFYLAEHSGALFFPTVSALKYVSNRFRRSAIGISQIANWFAMPVIASRTYYIAGHTPRHYYDGADFIFNQILANLPGNSERLPRPLICNILSLLVRLSWDDTCALSQMAFMFERKVYTIPGMVTPLDASIMDLQRAETTDRKYIRTQTTRPSDLAAHLQSRAAFLASMGDGAEQILALIGDNLDDPLPADSDERARGVLTRYLHYHTATKAQMNPKTPRFGETVLHCFLVFECVTARLLQRTSPSFHWPSWHVRTELEKLLLDHGAESALLDSTSFTDRPPLSIPLVDDILPHLNMAPSIHEAYRHESVLRHNLALEKIARGYWTMVDTLDLSARGKIAARGAFEVLMQEITDAAVQAGELGRGLATFPSLGPITQQQAPSQDTRSLKGKEKALVLDDESLAPEASTPEVLQEDELPESSGVMADNTMDVQSAAPEPMAAPEPAHDDDHEEDNTVIDDVQHAEASASAQQPRKKARRGGRKHKKSHPQESAPIIAAVEPQLSPQARRPSKKRRVDGSH